MRCSSQASVRREETNLEAEPKEATISQDTALRLAKVGRRRMVAATRRKRGGNAVPDKLLAIGRASTPSKVSEQIGEMISVATGKEASLGGQAVGAPPADGARIQRDLRRTDAAQETKRLAALAQKVREFCAAKGLLHTGLKVINDAGHEIHSSDGAAAGAYNLKILHRRAPKHAGTAPAVTPAA